MARLKHISFIDELKSEVYRFITYGINSHSIIERLRETSLYKISPKLAKDDDEIIKLVDQIIKSYASYEETREILEKTLVVPINNRNWLLFDQDTGYIKLKKPDNVRHLFSDRTIYLANARHCEVTYDPHTTKYFFKKEGQEFFNRYTPPKWKRDYVLKGTPIPIESEVPPQVLEFLMNMTGGHEKSVDYILDWLAHSLRTQNQSYLCLIGAGGVGKGIFSQFLKHVYGPDNWNKEEFKKGTGNFNSKMYGKTFLFMDEANASEGTAQTDALKLFNDPQIDIEFKGQDRFLADNHINLMMASNHLSSLNIPPGDRRFSIVNIGSRRLNHIWSLDKIIQFRDDEELGYKFARYLWTRKIKWPDMNEPFMDSRSIEVIEASTKDWQKWIIDEFCKDNAGRTLRVTDLIKESANSLTTKVNLSTATIRDLATKFPGIFEVVKTDDYDYLFPHDDAGKSKNRVYCVSILDKAKQKSYDLVESET